MNRQNQILTTLLVLQIVLGVVVLWPRPATTGGNNLFPGVQTDQIVKLTIQDAAGQQVQLAKSAGGWVLSQLDDYPAQPDTVTTLLDKLAALKADHLIAQTDASHKQLKVTQQDLERAVEFELAGGARHKLYLGSSAGYQATHVRADDRPQVYLASGLSTMDVPVQASGWVTPTYLAVPQDQIVALTVQNANGTLEFERDASGVWTMKGLAAGESLDQSKLSGLTGRLGTLNLFQPLGKTEQEAYGLKSPSAIVTAKARDPNGAEKTYTLRIGAKNDQNSTYVVISSESPYYVQVSEYSVQDWVKNTRGDLVQAPPTLTATITSTLSMTPTLTPAP